MNRYKTPVITGDDILYSKKQGMKKLLEAHYQDNENTLIYTGRPQSRTYDPDYKNVIERSPLPSAMLISENGIYDAFGNLIYGDIKEWHLLSAGFSMAYRGKETVIIKVIFTNSEEDEVKASIEWEGLQIRYELLSSTLEEIKKRANIEWKEARKARTEKIYSFTDRIRKINDMFSVDIRTLALTNDEAYEMYSGEYGTYDSDSPIGYEDFARVSSPYSISAGRLKDLGYSMTYLINGIRLMEENHLARKIGEDKKAVLADTIKHIWQASESIRETYEQYSRIIRGIGGEKTVTEYIKNITAPGWVYIPNIVFPAVNGNIYGQKTFECDGILITERNIYVLEIKNYTTGSVTVTNDGTVKHYGSKGNIINEDKTMIEQCENNVILLSRLLEEKTGRSVINNIKGIIVIANNNIQIDNSSRYPVVRLSLLRTEVMEYEYRTDNGFDVQKTAKDLDSIRIPEYKFEFTLASIDDKEAFIELEKAVCMMTGDLADMFMEASQNEHMPYEINTEGWLDGYEDRYEKQKKEWTDAMYEYLDL